MGPRSLALTLALTLAGCAGTDSGAATAGARQFVVAVGTPLYAVVKGATCVITAVGSLLSGDVRKWSIRKLGAA